MQSILFSAAAETSVKKTGYLSLGIVFCGPVWMATALPLLKAMARSDPLGFAQGVGNKPALRVCYVKKGTAQLQPPTLLKESLQIRKCPAICYKPFLFLLILVNFAFIIKFLLSASFLNSQLLRNVDKIN